MQLLWFIGSGAAGQSFLWSDDGFLFQAPVTWYSQKRLWDVSPGYQHDRSTRWNRPVEPDCLYCHASLTRPIYGTQNRYADPPFIQGGVACERCHGPASDHIAGRGHLVNPAKLEPYLRDSVCSQCHLSGEARVNLPGRSIAMFRPGEPLRDFVSYFVPAGATGAAVKATGYVEKLQTSRCKVVSGDRLWCGTCHDPHAVPEPLEAAAYFRGKCLGCHQQAECTRGPDCRSCHMPRAQAIDGNHGVLTDHGIPRIATTATPKTTTPEWKLEAFPGFPGDTRSTGLAYAQVALRTENTRQSAEAIRLLSAIPPDAETLVTLADLSARAGDAKGARERYAQAYRLNPRSQVILVNLGTCEAEVGNIARARSLWITALTLNPGLTEAAVNLRKLSSVTALTPTEKAAVERAFRIEQGAPAR
jgi:predicted CXXCH cytochrome family protein